MKTMLKFVAVTHHYEWERKANLVSGQKIWLGMGAALCLAGMAGDGVFRGIIVSILNR